MFARPGVHLVFFDVQLADIPKESLCAPGRVRNEIRAGPLGAPDRSVGEIDDIGYMADSAALVLQISPEQIGDDETAVAADMGHVMDGGTTGIDPYLFGAQGLEELLLPGQGVVQPQRHFTLFGEQIRTQIALAAVGKDYHQDPARHFPGLPEAYMHGGAGTHPHQEPLFSGQSPGCFEGILIENVDLLVQEIPVEYPGTIGFLHVL